MTEQLHVCDFQIKVIMLQISPGREQEVAERFARELKRLHKSYKIFKALGSYDLFIIYESPDFLPDVIDIGTIPNILKSNELLCFPWEIKDAAGNSIKGGFNFDDLNKKILGLSFAKINPASILREGVRVENILISSFRNVSNVSILGSFGWNEIVFLVHGDTIKTTYETLLDLSDLKLGYPEDQNQQNTLTVEALFLKTLSFLGINFELFDTLQTDHQFLANALPEKISRTFFPHLHITCCPEEMDRLVRDAAEAFGQPNVIVGAEDVSIIVTGKMLTWGAFLTALFNFRQKNKAHLFATTVRINKKQKYKAITRDRAHSKNTIKNYPAPLLISNDEALSLKAKFHRTFQMHLLNTLYTFNNLIQNNIVREAYVDMIPFAREIKTIALSDDSDTQQIAIYLDHFIFGAQQRASSTYSGIDNIEYRFSPFKGGIQRVLQAIELLPKSMLSNIGLNWSGIINAGEDDTFRSDYVVLNIPVECLFSPSQWWGLFHEIGHVATLTSDLLDFDDKNLENFLSGQIGITKNDPEFAEFINLCWEISADIFDYKFGFLKDIDTYFASLWEYLETYISRRETNIHKIEKYIFRSFYVYLYDQIWYKREYSIDSLDNRSTVLNLLEQFIAYLNSIKAKEKLLTRDISDSMLSNIALTSLTLKPLLIHLRSKYTKIARSDATIEAASGPKINEIINTLKKGQIYWKKIDHPEMIIYRLRKERISEVKINIATILSFWHTFNLRFRKTFDS